MRTSAKLARVSHQTRADAHIPIMNLPLETTFKQLPHRSDPDPLP